MSAIKFSVNDSRWKSKLAKLRVRVTAKTFEPQLRRFVRNSLTSAVRLTPVRNFAIIRANQVKQYAHRVNYIPSYHEESDPCLIVRDEIHWVKYNGQWYKANQWRLSDEVWSVYQQLLFERDRRLTTQIGNFIRERAQARFLYARSWYQCGQSIGITVPIDGNIRDSHSRHNPPKSPPRGYAQIRGGRYTLSVVIFNPFLEQRSEYKPWSGKAVIADAMSRHEAAYMTEVGTKLRDICASVN